MSTLADRHADAVLRLIGAPQVTRMKGAIIGASGSWDPDTGEIATIAIQFRTPDGSVFDVNGVSDPVAAAIKAGDLFEGRQIMVDVVTDENGVSQLFAAYLWTGTA